MLRYQQGNAFFLLYPGTRPRSEPAKECCRTHTTLLGMNMGASSKTTAGLTTDPAQGNHTQNNLKEFFYSRPGKNCKTNCKDCSRKSVNQGKFSSPCPGTPSFFNRWRLVWRSCIQAGGWGFTTTSLRMYDDEHDHDLQFDIKTFCTWLMWHELTTQT